jgi:3-deoxy-manno-octulosonate cytidylyltransferase (CMP-KDO synthetase)
MTAPRTRAVIPARLASSRFPGKPLINIAGLPMIEHVRRRAALAAVDEVVVATCDPEIAKVVESYGGIAVMTSSQHERATSRVAEACGSELDAIVVIVQGDEPLVLPDAITRVVEAVRADPRVRCANLLSPLSSDTDPDNPDVVKAVCGFSGDVVYFSRASIPFFRERAAAPVYRQTGIMAFTSELLRQFDTLPQGRLERVESVDMLRMLEHGIAVRGVVADAGTIGVDRPGDVPLAERLLAEDPEQRRLFDRIRADVTQRPVRSSVAV